MDIKEEVIKLLLKVKEQDEYSNPHFLQDILISLEEVYGYENNELRSWVNNLFDR